MDRQENPLPTPPLGTFGILREALKTTCRNGRLSAVILLCVYFSISQLEFGIELTLTPVLRDLSSHFPVYKKAISFTHHPSPVCVSFEGLPSGEFKYAHMPRLAHQKSYIFVNEITEKGSVQRMRSSPGETTQDVFPANGYMHQTVQSGGLKDVRSLLGVQLIVLAFCSVILLFSLVATISSSYEAYTAKVMTLKDVFLTFRGSWIRPIHTGFYLSLITFGILGLFGMLIGLVSIFTEGSSAYLLYALLFVSSWFWYLHMSALWILSLVVSVLESDASGLKAIDRAGDLMKGKKIQTYVLMLLFDFATGAVYMIAFGYARKLDKWTKMAITIPFTIELICIFKLLMIVAFVIYYHERKMSCKEEAAEGRLHLNVSMASDEV